MEGLGRGQNKGGKEEWSSGGEGDAVEMPEGASWDREHSTPCHPELRLPVHEQKLQKHPNREET